MNKGGIMPTLRERKKRKTNETIVAEAARLFMAKGFAETTIDEIAAAAEVGVGTLYNYYKSKYELLLAVVETIVGDNLIEAEKLIAKPYDDPVEHLVDFIMLMAQQWFDIEHRLMADIFIATFQNYDKFANGILEQDVRDIDMMTRLFETLKE
jgi:AcrR family transcriptional regulator